MLLCNHSNNNTPNELVVALIAATVTFLLNFIYELTKEKRRQKNIILYAQSEIDINIKYAVHNSNRVEKYNENTPVKNFLYFRNDAAIKLLSDDKLKMTLENRNILKDYIVVTEHVNSIIDEFKAKPTNISNLKEYCMNLKEGEGQVDSIMIYANKLKLVLKTYESCFKF